MKLIDVGIFMKAGGFFLCRKNSRGLPQSGGINVTNQVIDFFLDNFETGKDEFYTYTRGNDLYRVEIRKMSEEEKHEHLRHKELKKRDLLIKLASVTLIYENAYKELRHV